MSSGPSECNLSDTPASIGGGADLACTGVVLSQNPSTGADEDRDVSWKKLVPNILEDQKHIWTFPLRLGQGLDVLPTVAVLGTTAGLVVADLDFAHRVRHE
jgi:hypothetical protein